MAERAQRAANRKNTCKLRKQLPQFDNTHTVNAHNTSKKKRAANRKNACKLRKHFRQFYNVLWAFAVCFFICLRCEHLHRLLSNWWKCFLDLLVFFLFACVFWSCSALSSLGHRRFTQKLKLSSLTKHHVIPNMYEFYLFIYSNWKPYDPSPQMLFYILWSDRNSYTPTPHWTWFWGAHSKFSAQGPEFLATALCKSMVFGVKCAVINMIINRELSFPFVDMTWLDSDGDFMLGVHIRDNHHV